MNAWEIRLRGIVQGVGFRPFVYQLAAAKNICGEVSNGNDGLAIRFNSDSQTATEFLTDILAQHPPRAHITHHELNKTIDQFFDNFQIIESEAEGAASLLLTPDYAICQACKTEMLDPDNRRHQYPFITCTSCGPRYSIIEHLPYDRPLTTMASFLMCPSCNQEYHNPIDRRHFSQTNSCSSCGISLELKQKESNHFDSLPEDDFANGKESAIPVSLWRESETCAEHCRSREEQVQSILESVVEQWKAGKIVAIQGIGGYLLTCDARNEKAVQRLRERKQRPNKPFAVMYPSIEHVDASYHLSAIEREELTHTRAPILLLRKKNESSKIAPSVAPGLSEIGIMLPYAPIFVWLLEEWKQPILATSANISTAPIIYESSQEEELFLLADTIVSHDRKIVIPQDDSVIRMTSRYDQRIVIRRSRGMAPTYFVHELNVPNMSILACGADMKSSFALLHQGNIYVSQYLGDLSHYDAQVLYQKVLNHLTEVLKAEPTIVLHDRHPDYASTHLATQIAGDKQLSQQAYGHHEAHFAAVLAENDLLESEKEVLGVIWDGTGYGEEGEIWGGEFFRWHEKEMSRVGHLAYFPAISGDKMAREPRLSALAILPEAHLIREKFSEQELTILDRLIERANLYSSSMGRLFDAVASILGICDVQSYEGEAAMKLEAIAREYLGKDFGKLRGYDVALQSQQMPPQALLQEIVHEKEVGESSGKIAARFHISLVQWIRHMADLQSISSLAFSGGVFQNALLVDLIIHLLSPNHELYFHKQLSPNDENIALGQLILYLTQSQ